ncbi:cysteine desulfurase family protein [Sphingomonas changbaiensis NBRC 104936]|uniref:Cysteine desulfurase family protein n=1 Tax=Sphingomonas changbaiensis NBRC 104936 TaxID=1219043 RepID=A0A0E9MRS1_9SPHN|nr:cysteine desulfurase-like protein [Sphingomonas changbaiensis]GAO40452.1 cysteine desulfurase family protein [Sphingomonas changbaiensis NBRC 104936]
MLSEMPSRNTGAAASFPIDEVRAQFPALRVGNRVYLDGPGGTQMCAPAIDAMVRHLESGTANLGGDFRTSIDTGAMSDAAHAAMADLLGAAPDEIGFGPNMTSLTLSVSRALAREWRDGDEIVVTRLDHDANVAPWLLAAEDRGVTVRWLDFDPDSGTLRIDTLPALLGPRTRLVAVGGASNAIGTLNDIPAIAAIVKAQSSAVLFVDAVQSVPHVITEVAALGCDLLVCSPYKFFGPHQGVLWGRTELLERLRPYKVRPAADRPPARAFETGTPSFEAQAAMLGTIDYFDALGTRFARDGASRVERLRAAFHAFQAYEEQLSARLLDGLRSIPSVKLWGPATIAGRVPTFGLTIANCRPERAAEALASRDIFAWAGHFYAIEVVARLGLAESGGLLRLGLCHYNTGEEIDRTLEALAAIAKRTD